MRRGAMNTSGTAVVKLSIEVIMLPVGYVDRVRGRIPLLSTLHLSSVRAMTAMAMFLQRLCSSSLQCGSLICCLTRSLAAFESL